MRKGTFTTVVVACTVALTGLYMPQASADTAQGGVTTVTELIDACRLPRPGARIELGMPCRDPRGWDTRPICQDDNETGCRGVWDPSPTNCFEARCVERVFVKDNVATTLTMCADEFPRAEYTICGDDPDSLNCAISTCKIESECEDGCVGPGVGLSATCVEQVVPYVLTRDGRQIDLNPAVEGPRVPLYQLDAILVMGPRGPRYVPWQRNWPNWPRSEQGDFLEKFCESEIPEDGDCVRAQCDDYGQCTNIIDCPNCNSVLPIGSPCLDTDKESCTQALCDAQQNCIQAPQYNYQLAPYWDFEGSDIRTNGVRPNWAHCDEDTTAECRVSKCKQGACQSDMFELPNGVACSADPTEINEDVDFECAQAVCLDGDCADVVAVAAGLACGVDGAGCACDGAGHCANPLGDAAECFFADDVSAAASNAGNDNVGGATAGAGGLGDSTSRPSSGCSVAGNAQSGLLFGLLSLLGLVAIRRRR